jgi:hypothetical protein
LSDLSKLRENWDEILAEEISLARAMSVQERLTQWLRLQNAFEWQLQQTEKLFAQQRRDALIELQARLRQLNLD